jgi:hypothetical protein
MSARTRADPTQIGASGDKDRQIEQDDPGQQTEGQTEGEASAPASAGDRLSRVKGEPKGSSRSGLGSRLPGWQARLAGLHVGAFWDPDDPTLISLPGPAWLGAGYTLALLVVDVAEGRAKHKARPRRSEPRAFPKHHRPPVRAATATLISCALRPSRDNPPASTPPAFDAPRTISRTFQPRDRSVNMAKSG